ncbi:MAG: asparagine synthetase B family protein [Gemmatimonadaceae bacterium]
MATATLGRPVEPAGRGEETDGVFACWRWDGARLVARNDRWGFAPLFYRASKDDVAISPDVAQLLEPGASAELDHRALAAFFHLGFFVGEDTPFAAVRALPPGGTLEWAPGSGACVRGAGYWWGDHPPTTRRGVADAFTEIFRDALGRRLPDDPDERFALPLSGGRDSRQMLLELCALGRPPALCVTHVQIPPLPDDDVRIARLVARAVGVEHVVVPLAPSLHQAERRRNAETSLCADEHAQLVALADYLRGRTRTTYDGIGADIWLSRNWGTAKRLDLYESGRLEELAANMAESLFQIVEAAHLAPMLSPELRPAASRELAIERIVAELARHAAAVNPVLSFYFWNRTRREVALAPFAMLQRAVPVVHAPYLDRALYDLLSSLPAAYALDPGFRDEIIARAHPRHAGLPYENRSAPGSDARAMLLRHARETARYAFARLPRRPRTVDGWRLLTRGLRTMVSAGYGARAAYLWRPALYLLQLDEVARTAVGR